MLRYPSVALGTALLLFLSLASAAPAHVRPAWQTVGSATVQDGGLVLTEPLPDQAGAAWQPAPRRLYSFQAAFKFAITEPYGAADGLTFVIQSASGDALGGAGGGLGYTGIPYSVAVEFDTWWNSAGEFGSPTSVDDPGVPHISIHTRGPEPNDVDEQYSLGATTDIPYLSDGNPHWAVITYQRRMLSVILDGQRRLSVPINLGKTLDLWHRRAWVGFTAATGGYWQRHEILWYRLNAPGWCKRWEPRYSDHGGRRRH